MNFEENLRLIAKSNYWQELYRSSKDIKGINLFENENNFSGLQIIFLNWLRVYALLYEELATQEWDNLTEEVINDFDRTDAFLYYRSKQIERKIRENKLEEKMNNKKSKGGKNDKVSTIFTGKKK